MHEYCVSCLSVDKVDTILPHGNAIHVQGKMHGLLLQAYLRSLKSCLYGMSYVTT